MKAAVRSLSIVMPVKVRTRHKRSDLERIRLLLLPSLVRYLDADCIETFWIVTRSDERDAVERVVAPFREALKIRLVCDDDVAPRAAKKSGWVKQQLLKLGMSHHVGTDCYLVLDSDVIAVRPTGWQDLFPGGVARMGREPRSTHAEWWDASAQILGIDHGWRPDRIVMGVTPQILYADATRGLLEHIERHGKRWPWSPRGWERILLARLGWTEYSLYWTFFCDRFGARERYALEGEELYGNCVWSHAAELDADLARRMFEEPVAPFAVIQSNIESLRVDDVVSRMEPWIRAAGRGTGPSR